MDQAEVHAWRLRKPSFTRESDVQREASTRNVYSHCVKLIVRSTINFLADNALPLPYRIQHLEISYEPKNRDGRIHENSYKDDKSHVRSRGQITDTTSHVKKSTVARRKISRTSPQDLQKRDWTSVASSARLVQPRWNPRLITRGSLLLTIIAIHKARSSLVCRVIRPRLPLNSSERPVWDNVVLTVIPFCSTKVSTRLITRWCSRQRLRSKIVEEHARRYTILWHASHTDCPGRHARADVERTWTSCVYTDAEPLGVAARNESAAWRLPTDACAPFSLRTKARTGYAQTTSTWRARAPTGSGATVQECSRCRRVSCHAALTDAIRSLRASWQEIPRSPENPENSPAETSQRC